MTLYKDYLKEREGLETFETPLGFALYKIQDNECYIQDIYVVPEKRRSLVGTHIANAVMEIAKSKGCKWLVGSVCPSANNSHASLLILLQYGMTLRKAEKDAIYFAKGI